MVSHHHTKLYGPADYRTDKGFLDAGHTVPTVEVGQKLAEELAVDAAEAVADVLPQAPPTDTLSISRSSQLKEAYVAEGLVFQALQAELGGSVRREVELSGSHVDGLIYSSDGTTTIVDVQIIARPSSDWSRRLREARNNLVRARSALKDEKVRLLIALVVRGNVGRVAEFKAKVLKSDDCEIRVYGFSELIERYGFGEEVTS